ncbi:MAG: hypothetical protein JRC87_00455 [Deltaproteobacteria bacterium]|nr:hypothetical protein [Deltaproteobacteria bacterium]MBW2658061.1 hypothetical protein [Deltaproteobacteria bacterium]
MRLICPHCGAEGTGDDSYREKMVRCPICGTSFGVFPWRKDPGTECGGKEVNLNIIEEPDRISVTAVIKDTWQQTKGAKASIWAAIAFIYLLVLLMEAAVSFFIPSCGLTRMAVSGYGICSVVQLVISMVFFILTAGLLYIGMEKVAGEPVSWRLIFRGGPFAGQIILAVLLQALFIGIGLIFLVVPGIYLAVCYSLTLPLIVGRELSAREAMKVSRKVIHKVWWRAFGLFGLMALVHFISFIVFGLGLIWTVPMFIILHGVLYHRLFAAGSNKSRLEVTGWEL